MSWSSGPQDVGDDRFLVNPPLIVPIPDDVRELTEPEFPRAEGEKLPRRDTTVTYWPKFN